MTNEQLIYISVGALISTCTRSVFAKYIDPHIPDAKKLISYTKKFFRFIFLYVFSVSCIIYLMIWYPKVDKGFVCAIAICFSTVVLNISTTISIWYLKLTTGTFRKVGESYRVQHKRIEALEKALKELIRRSGSE